MSARLSTEQLQALRGRVERARTAPGQAADPIARREGGGPAELSFAQQRLWFLDQLVPGNPFYNIPAALPLRLAIDEGALRRALAEIVTRHEALRTLFVNGADGPRQLPGAAYDPLAAMLDLSDLHTAERHQRLQRIATDEARAPFDLARGPLLRARLVRLAATEHVLLLTLHHIVSDGWSMGVLLRELMQLYDAFCRGAPSPLAPLPIQYADYAAWQRRTLTPQRVEALLGYWRTQLAGAPTLALVTDRPRPPMASFRGAFLDVAFDAHLTTALEALARRHDATLFQVLLAALNAVLARYAGQTDIVVGAPIANRLRPEIEGLIGFFVNSLVLRTDLAGDPPFAEIVARVRRTTIAAYQHQDLPFERLVEELQPTRDMSRNPLAQVTFQIQNAPGALREKPAGLDPIVRIDRATAIFDLAFSLWETRSGLVGGIEYATDIFDAATVQGLVDSLASVLRAVVADDTLTLAALPLGTAAAQASWRALARGDEVPLPDLGLFEAFAAAAQARPDDVVLVDDAGALTCGALLAQARTLAGALAARGVVPGATVALILPRGRRFVTAMLAALDAGAAWLPMDPAMPQARMQHMLAIARPALVLREGDALVDGLFGERDHASPACAARGDAPAYVLFTSGSTGVPKGVVVPHRALANHMAWMRSALPQTGAGGRVLQRTPLHFDAALWELWAPLLGDGVLLLPAPFDAADTGALCAAIEHHRASVLQIVPSLLRLLLDDPALPRCTTIERVCIGGEALGADLLAKARARWPRAQLVNLYGPTEATIDATWWVADPAWPASAPAPVGRPVWNTRIGIRDAEGRPLPPGVVGEIWIEGLALASGYLGAGAADEARFVVDADGKRHYRCGDLGWVRRDGLVFCAGRVDGQVKLRGNRIELGEVEAALVSHPAVASAVALAVASDAGPAQDLLAFVTLQPGATFDAGTEAQAAERARVDQWRALYASVYDPRSAPVDGDVGFDTTGWTSSYDDRAIAAPAMREWLDATLARLRTLRPRRVLEVGCGAGMIVAGLAPRCQRYLACDFSAPAIDRARRAVDRGGIAHVRLEACAAHEVAALGEQGFDLAIANSVIQYFPSLAYLQGVLRLLRDLLAPGGRAFVGDVRHHGLLEAFHCDVQRMRHAGTAGEFRERVRAAVAQDKELLVAPAWFWHGAGGAFTRAAVRLKRGTIASEMLAFRYDVVLQSSASGASAAASRAAPPAITWHDWRRGGLDLVTLAGWLRTQSGAVGLEGIPNARLARAAALQASLADAPAGLPLADLLAAAETRAGEAVDPEALARAAEAAGWFVELIPSPQQADAFVAVLHQGTLQAEEADAALMVRRPPVRTRVASNPLLATIGAAVERALKAHLASLLPQAMVPTRIEPLAELPLLPSGKADRHALAALGAARRRPEPVALSAPADALQALICDIWAAVLRLKRVGTEDHFFNDLGGHSLLATQAVSRLRQALEIDIALRLLFEHPTVSALAAALVGAHGAELVQLADIVREVAALDEATLDQRLAAAGPATDGGAAGALAARGGHTA